MERDDKKTITPNINEELMMNLMVDGVKKEGLQLPLETAPESMANKEGEPNAPFQERFTVRDKNLIRTPVMEKQFIYGPNFMKSLPELYM